jgi:hypothetical protein
MSEVCADELTAKVLTCRRNRGDDDHTNGNDHCKFGFHPTLLECRLGGTHLGWGVGLSTFRSLRARELRARMKGGLTVRKSPKQIMPPLYSRPNSVSRRGSPLRALAVSAQSQSVPLSGGSWHWHKPHQSAGGCPAHVTEGHYAYRPLQSENLVHLCVNLLAPRRLQVAHCAFHVGMTEPLLHRPEIDTSPQAAGCERGAELV